MLGGVTRLCFNPASDSDWDARLRTGGFGLGHESMETTQMCIDADLELKEKILEKTSTQTSPVVRYKPDDQLLAFLNSL